VSLSAFNRWQSRWLDSMWGIYAGLDRVLVDSPWGDANRTVKLHGPHLWQEQVRTPPPGVDAGRWIDFLKAISHPVALKTGALMEAWVMAGYCSTGPRLYCPGPDEFAALGQSAIPLPWGEYRQPFPTMTVVVPEACANPVGELGRPVVLMTRFDPVRRLLAFIVSGTGDKTFSTFFTWSEEDAAAELIEDRLSFWEGKSNAIPDGYDPHHFLPLDESEQAFFDRVKRITMNASLLLTNYGCRDRGPANPEYAAKLDASLKKKSLPESARSANERARKMIPTVYAIDQEIALYRREAAPRAAGEESGRAVKPHWRRGHWALQPHGPAQSLRKRIYRAPVMIHPESFAGSARQTQSVYMGNWR
jgi:hypothetical protein